MPIYSKGVGIASALSTGVGRLADNARNRDEIQAKASEAKLRKNTADAANDPELIENRLAALDAQNRQLIANQANVATTNAFRLYIKTGNTNHLTDLMKKNKRVREQFRGIATITNIDPEVDRRLLAENGISLEDFREIRHLKATMPDGTIKLFDAFDVAVGTGAMLTILGEEVDLANKWLKATGKDGSGLKGELYHNAQSVASLLPEETEETAMRSLFAKKESGLLAGKEKEAEEALTSLVDTFGGEDGFFNTDFSIESNRIKATRDLRRYKRFGGQDLTAKQQGEIVDLSKLVALAGTVGDKLTPEVTGVYDTFLRNIRTFISGNVDQVDQVAAQSAYEAFRATFRHALSGTALTDNEIKLFNTAYGKISLKYPAVAAQFKTMLNEVKSKLEAIQQLNDPYLAHYYLGSKVSNVNSIINRIDERLELISQAQGNESGQFANKTREGVGDKQVVTPNDPSPTDPNDPNSAPPDVNTIFEKYFGVGQ